MRNPSSRQNFSFTEENLSNIAIVVANGGVVNALAEEISGIVALGSTLEPVIVIPDEPPLTTFDEHFMKSRSSIFTRVVNGKSIYPPAPDTPAFGSYTQPSYANTGLRVNNINEEDLLPYPDELRNITQDDTIIEGYLIDAVIRVRAKNVVFRNCLMDGSGYYGVDSDYEADGQMDTLIEYCEFRHLSSAGFVGANTIVRRCTFHLMQADALKPKYNCLIEQNYITLLGSNPSSHADGVQLVTGGDTIVRGNYFDMTSNVLFEGVNYKNSQCIICLSNIGSVSNLQVYNNWIRGGGIAVQIRDKTTSGFGAPYNCVVAYNIFYQDSWTSSPWNIDNIGTSYGQNQVYGNTNEFGALLPNQLSIPA